MRRKEVVKWLEVDPVKAKPLVPSVLKSALHSQLSVLDRSGQQLLSQLQAIPSELVQILSHLKDTKQEKS